MGSSHRCLTHRHAKRVSSGVTRDILPGESRLSPFYSPSLQGGLHTVTVSQSISAPPLKSDKDQTTRREDTIQAESQRSYVVAPKFNLPVGCVESVFPFPGTTATSTVLPHVVLKSPYLPWERESVFNVLDPTDNDEEGNPRRRTPWLALLPFTPEELKLGPDSIESFLINLPDELDRVQGESLAVRMRACDTPWLDGITGLTNAISFNVKLDARDAGEAVDVVFVPKALFHALFGQKGNEASLDVARYKYLAHVRQIATDGMAVAGSDSDEGIYSVILSHRTALIDEPLPTSTIAHLLSLDMREDLVLPLPDQITHVAMLSVHSWTYTCLPSKHLASTHSRLTHIGTELNIMQPQIPPKSADSVDNNPDKIAALVSKRQADGYTLLRHRTVTGEITAAMFRGPLTPIFVAHPFRKDFSMQSNSGTDLQILDPDLSMLDISYSTAWQLGKTLAMGDEAFSASLARLRNAVDSQSLKTAKKEIGLAQGGYSSRRDTAPQMLDLVKGLKNLNQDLHDNSYLATTTDENRWNIASSNDAEHEILDMSRHSPYVSTGVASLADASAASFARSSDGILYNEYNIPVNTDSAHVLSWVLDKLNLADIPGHYLIPNPSYLPEEALRFFFIDENWTDALVDGALSLASHLGAKPGDDVCRTAIKKAINECLYTPNPKLGHIQIPKYGFMLRSQLLVQFPDVTVAVKYVECTTEVGNNETPKLEPASILAQKRIGSDSVYCLFDCVPPEIETITFTLPPHQQCFTIGTSLSKDALAVSFKRVYTVTEVQRPQDRRIPLTQSQFKITDPTPMFDWSTRTLNVATFAQLQLELLRKGMNGEFTDTRATSALLAYQFNDPILQLDIGDLSKQSVSASREISQLSTPATNNLEPPQLLAFSEPLTPKQASIGRLRPPSPLLEASLIDQY